jgi:hypothetical protein
VIKHFIRQDSSSRKEEVTLWRNLTDKYLNKTYLEVPWYIFTIYTTNKKVLCRSLFLSQNHGNHQLFLYKQRSFRITKVTQPHFSDGHNSVCYTNIFLILSAICATQSVFRGYTLEENEFITLLHGSLWGNRSDLSLNPEGVNKLDFHHTVKAFYFNFDLAGEK